MYAVLHQGDAALALAPCFLMNVPIELVVPPAIMPIFRLLGKIAPASQYQRTLFVGSPCSDEGTVGFLGPVDRRQALLALQDALQQKAWESNAPMLVWKDIPSELASDMEWLAAHCGLFPLTSFPGASMTLPGGTKEAYYAAMKASRRQKIRRKLRKSEEAVQLTVEVIHRPAPAVLDEIFALFMQTYAKAETKFERLNRRFFELIAEKPVSHFITLRDPTGAVVAFMLCFALGHHLINKFIGIDYSRPREWVLYFRLWDAVVDWALAQGFSSIQSGQTGYSAKIELGNQLVPLTNYCRHRNPLIHFIYKKVAATISWETLDEDLAAHLAAHPEDRLEHSGGSYKKAAA
jgi:hypothetical protein